MIRNCRGGLFGGAGARCSVSDYEIDIPADQIRRELPKLIVLPLSPTKFNRYVLAFNVACSLQATAKSGCEGNERFWRRAAKKPDDPPLLRDRSDR